MIAAITISFPAGLTAIPSTASGPGGMDMMDDAPSAAIFVAAVIAVSLVAAAIVPRLSRRLSLRQAVPVLALVGPVLALIGGLIGSGAMILSGRDVWYSLLVAVAAGAAAIIVGLQVALPVARDLEQISTTVKAVAGGDRKVATEVARSDEIGELATAVDDLCRSLAAAEANKEAADEERNAVVSALSHDLRTPLASLLVSLDAIEDGIGEPRSHLRAMRGNVVALERLIEDMFLLARADAGALALHFETLDLAELLDDAAEAVGPLAQSRAVGIATTLDRSILVDGDHTALGRVFRNLLENAVRHSPDGEPIRIDHRVEQGSIRVAVLDQGEGFAPDFVPRALDRFTQADDARTRRGASGLGLAIADALVTAHRGRVKIHPGPGGRVEVELPTLT